MIQKNINNLFSKKHLQNLLNKFEKNNDKFYIKEEVNVILDNYKILMNSYRNEYFYKNNLFNKIVLGKHSLNTTYALNETIINKSKADMIIVNNNLPIVYEIKTELDNFDKLEHQINDYFKISSFVYAVTAESTYYPLYRILKDSNVGIYVLTKRNTLSLRKIAKKNCEKLEYNALFKLLRKREYENIIMGYFGYKPRVNDFNYYSECLKLFGYIDIQQAQKLAFEEINKRESNYHKEYIHLLPYEIRWLAYIGNFNETSYKSLVNIFME